MSILIISFNSGSISLNLLSGTILVSIIISIQYRHSDASFRAIQYFDKKSAFDCANSASSSSKLQVVSSKLQDYIGLSSLKIYRIITNFKLATCYLLLATYKIASSKFFFVNSVYAFITLIANFLVLS